MQEHKQIQLYVGFEEGGCVDVGAIKLDGFTLIATSELDALKAERDALAAHNSELVSACKLAIDMFVANECNVPNTIETLQDAIDENPQQHLAEIRAEAVEVFAMALSNTVQIPNGPMTRVDYYKAAIRHAIQFANQYAAKVRQGGEQ